MPNRLYHSFNLTQRAEKSVRNRNDRYPEEKLAKEFLPWFKKTYQYDERFEDIDTSGSDPVDSAGFIQDDTLLIELKNRVSGSVFYEGSKGSSIEKKICTVLKNLYQNNDDRVTQSIVNWNKTKEPIFVLVANHYSERVIQDLNGLLKKRSDEWRFAYKVLQWNGEHTESVVKSREPSLLSPALFESITFPYMPSTAPRRPKPYTIGKLKEDSIKNGVDAIVDIFLDKLAENNARFNSANQSNIGYWFPELNEEGKPTAIALWPKASTSKVGLLITYQEELLQRRFGIHDSIDLKEILPGKQAPIHGHLSHYLYLTSPEEAAAFWNILNR